MKLAEALLEKKELIGRVVGLGTRISEASVFPEGEIPEENAAELLAGFGATFDQIQALTVRINQTNNLTPLVEGSSVSLMQAIAQRDVLKLKIAHYSSILGNIKQRNRNHGYMQTPQKMVVAEGIDVPGLIKLVDDLSKEARVLDTALQAANWTSELL